MPAQYCENIQREEKSVQNAIRGAAKRNDMGSAKVIYWRGNKDRGSLQRVYGISYPDQKRLKEYIALLEVAKKYDHIELGKKQELFFLHPLSPGSCFFLPHGTRITDKLTSFIKTEYR